MTINELCEIINNKLDSAVCHYIRECKTDRKPKDVNLINILKGEIEAYTDILCLLVVNIDKEA